MGAGVSLASGLPSWNQLVLALYHRAASGDLKNARWLPYPNYLYAIAEWQLEHGHESLEITARKIEKFYNEESELFQDLKATLYAGLVMNLPANWKILEPTCFAKVIQRSKPWLSYAVKPKRTAGGFMQLSLTTMIHASQRSFIPVWKSSNVPTVDQRAIIHVHGFIPIVGEGSPPGEIVFMEQQYHAAAHSPYSWSNLSQIQCLSSSVGLMIGLSFLTVICEGCWTQSA